MPGSPYIEPPPGLLTWPRLLRWAAPTLAVLTMVAIWKEVYIEWLVLCTALLAASALLRR